MEISLWKRLVGGFLASTMLLTYPGAYAAGNETAEQRGKASDDYIMVDDNATDKSQENYFEYQGGEDQNGETGWSSKPSNKDWSLPEIKTQHWVWTQSEDAALGFTYSFTFKGTGVELIGIKSDEYMTFQLDKEAAREQEIQGQKENEVILYKKEGLPYDTHTVKVSMAQGKGGHGLQVSCAKVYGSKLPRLMTTTIPYTKQDGEMNRFKFSPRGWSEQGDEKHCWSDAPSQYDPGAIWYEVNFIGSQIDIWAGKNKPHGNVSYTIYEIDSDTVVKGPIEVSHYNKNGNVEPAKIYSFKGLDENKAYRLRAVALGTGEGSKNIIDCGQVVVHHHPYPVEDFVPSETAYKLAEGQSQQIGYTVTPSYAAIDDMEYTSSDPGVASVDAATGRITANKAGNAVITMRSPTYAQLGEKQIQVTVEAANPALDGSIVDIDTQYTEARYQAVSNMEKVHSGTLTAWKNDTAISALALISKDSVLKNVRVEASDLVPKNGGSRIAAKNVTPTFIKSTKAYVGPFLGYGSNRPNAPIPPETATNRKESADILYQTAPMDIGWNEVQPVWVEFYIPVDAAAGEYTTTLTVNADGIKAPLTFDYTVTVQNATLPDAQNFKDRFSIEFWHHPYASAEYYDVVPFSQEHMAILDSIQDIYKEIGGNTIYGSLIEEPWNGQTWSKYHTNDRPTYPSMIKWMKDDAGNFTFDYSDFDKWVQFNIDKGLGDKIVMFSVAPWHNSFKYYDKETGVRVTETFDSVGGIGSDRYNEIWRAFFTDFIMHLEEKDWFDRTYVGIDERGFNAKAFDIVESVKNSQGKHLKIMGYMDSIKKPDLYELALRCTDYSIGDFAAVDARDKYQKLLAERNAKNLKTTFYSCTEHRPGNFSLSAPVESYFSVINAGKGGTTGFARWAYDAWVPDPLEDATHSSFEPGDCFVIYPDLKSNKNHAVSKKSVRLSRMAEGVRDMNKIKLMAAEYPQLQPKVDALYELIATKAYKDTNNYLTDEQISKLSQEMNAFKGKLAELTEEYIALGGKGDTTAKGKPSGSSGGGSPSGNNVKPEKNPDGSTTTTEKLPDGTVIKTTQKADGSITRVETKPDGAVTETNKTKNGTTSVVRTDANGNVTQASAQVSDKDAQQAQQKGEAVKLPMQLPAADTVEKAVTVKVDVPKSGAAVEIPVKGVTAGMVAVIVHPDGTEEIVKKTALTDEGVSLMLAGSTTLKLVDNSKTFGDVQAGDWHKRAVDFISARELMQGVSEGRFIPNAPLSRGMLAKILHNMENNPSAAQDSSFSDVKDGAWYADAIDWAVEKNILSGYGDGMVGPNDNITREQLAVMLYRYVGSPETSHTLSGFADGQKTSVFAQKAMAWAVEQGIVSGKGGSRLDPLGQASRAEAAQMLMNYYEVR